MLFLGAVDRAGMHFASRLATLLNYLRINLIEFGCGGDNRLINAEIQSGNIGCMCFTTSFIIHQRPAQWAFSMWIRLVFAYIIYVICSVTAFGSAMITRGSGCSFG